MLLVRQYRHPVGYKLLEPPAGLLDVQGEQYRWAPSAELWEETATKARRLADPGRCVHLARSDQRGGPDLPGPRPVARRRVLRTPP
jgi:hypothetical protein